LLDIKLEKLLEAGVHFGHQVHRWNPKMRLFIYGQKGGVHIFDLTKTIKYLQEALEFVKKLAQENKTLLFVGTKKQAQEIIQKEATKAGCPYVNYRWLGGLLTNFTTIKKQINKMDELAEGNKDLKENLTKKERRILAKKLEKLKENFKGLSHLQELPDAVFIADVNKDYLAVKEAQRLGIPIIAICDTNSDPTGISYIIPANDDAIRSLQLIISLIADTFIKNKPKTSAKIEKKEIKDDKIKEEVS